MSKKSFSLFSVVLSTVCIIFVTEAAAPVAAIGNSQFFWWIFMLVLFLLPYGLVSAELGTAYPDSAGIYGWISRAFPHSRWTGRFAWCYSVNLTIYIASLSIMVPALIEFAFGITLNIAITLLIQLAVVWLVAFASCFPIADNIIILNTSAILKFLLAFLVGGIGIFFGFKYGFANSMSPKSFLPTFDLHSLKYISVIIFNLLGFELICTFAKDMPNPKRQIPQAIVISGVAVAVIYLFSGFGIGAAIPYSEISPSTGLVDSFVAMGITNKLFLSAVALLFILTLFGTMVSWSIGVNQISSIAAQNNDLPRVYSKLWAHNGMPVGSVIISSIISSIVVLLSCFFTYFAPNSNLFWSLFSISLVLFICSYIPMFFSFLKLRKIDPYTERPFKVSGKPFVLKAMVIIPVALIVISIVFTAIPLSLDVIADMLPTTIGTIILILVGELMISYRSHRK